MGGRLSEHKSTQHLQRLVGYWGMLADVSFSDLFLAVPLDSDVLKDLAIEPLETTGEGFDAGESKAATVASGAGAGSVGLVATGEGGAGAGAGSVGAEQASRQASREDKTERSGPRFVVVAQVRPTTSQTLFPGDLVGNEIGREATLLAREVWDSGAPARGGTELDGETIRMECVPVRMGDQIVAVMVRAHLSGLGRRQGELERTYLELFDRLAQMVAEGTLPFAGEEFLGEEAPRVGDGLLVVNESGLITFSSPNAMSALHRLGVRKDVRDKSISELGVEMIAIDRALAQARPVIEEVERPSGAIVLFHAIPLIAKGTTTGALVLVRDVSDLRQRDRLLLSKDAAIREVHHRVKNNLQTISSLLRLQARRTTHEEAAGALREAERRIQSISVVHEILARDPGDEVIFDEIVESLVRMTEDVTPSGTPITIEVDGEAGEVNADIATPLAVVIAELMQNAIEHAFPGRSEGRIWIRLDRTPELLHVQVADDGLGLPEGFRIDTSKSLGLSIVRTLVTTQMNGTLDLHNQMGAVVDIRIPLAQEE